ncbi:hypothetical protein TKK_0015082 [Trichogramma kaykai]
MKHHTKVIILATKMLIKLRSQCKSKNRKDFFIYIWKSSFQKIRLNFRNYLEEFDVFQNFLDKDEEKIYQSSRKETEDVFNAFRKLPESNLTRQAKLDFEDLLRTHIQALFKRCKSGSPKLKYVHKCLRWLVLGAQLNLTGSPANTVDLHYLVWEEALMVVKEFLKHQSLRELPTKCKRECTIVTGKGLHSDEGTKTLKSRVELLLKEKYPHLR